MFPNEPRLRYQLAWIMFILLSITFLLGWSADDFAYYMVAWAASATLIVWEHCNA